MSKPLFQIVPEKTLGPVLKALPPVILASACSAGPGAPSLAGEASGIGELDTDRNRQGGREKSESLGHSVQVAGPVATRPSRG